MSSKSRERIFRDEDKRYSGPPLRLEEAKYLTSRIVVSNIDDRVIRETLEDKFNRYGRVLGVSMHRGFAYVQFESETAAYSAIKTENDTVFAGNKIDVRLVKDSRKDEKPKFFPVQAGRRRSSPPPRRESNALRDNYNRSSFRDRSPVRDEFNARSRGSPRRDTDERSQRTKLNEPGHENRDAPKTNDCEIIVFDKAQRTYAEIVEWRLKSIGMQVDMLFPKAESPLVDILEDIGNRGSLYAIVISPQNEIHRSLTVNILCGDLQEHRNMPTDDAMQLITKHFENYKREQSAPKVPFDSKTSNNSTSASEQQPLSSREEIQHLLRMLADGKQITLIQLDHVIMHLKEFREFLVSADSSNSQSSVQSTQNNVVRMPQAPAHQEEELKKTLLSLLGGANSFAGVLGGGGASGLAPTAQPPPQQQQQQQPIQQQHPTQQQHLTQQQATRVIEETYSTPNSSIESSSSWNRSFNPVSDRAQSLYNNPSEKLNPSGLILENPNVKKALDTLIQTGATKLFQSVDVAPNPASAQLVGVGGYLLPQQQQQQQQPQYYPGPTVATAHPQQQAYLGAAYHHPAAVPNQQQLMATQRQLLLMQQQGGNFPGQFY